jgi:hypothetical protein
MIHCDNCDMADFCSEIKRCFKKGIDTTDEDGILTPDEELNFSELRKAKKVNIPKKISQAHKDLINDFLNF